MQKRVYLFIGVTLAYMTYYFLRKNFSIAIPYLENTISKDQLGLVLSATSLAYGISNFLMGIITDFINPKKFLLFGLSISILVNIIFGLAPVQNSIIIMFLLMFINGFAQGIGYPTSSKIISTNAKSSKEQNTIVTVWSLGQNIGGGLMSPLATFGIGIISYFSIISIFDYKGVFLFPAIISLVFMLITYLLFRSPSIETLSLINKKEDFKFSNFKNYTGKLLKNKFFLMIIFLNIIAYFIRYAILDWSPLLLSEVKHINSAHSSMLYMLYEWLGSLGTLLFSFILNKLKSKDAPLLVAIFFIFIVITTVSYFYLSLPHIILGLIFVCIGLLVYGPLLYVNIETMTQFSTEYIGTAIGLLGFGGNVIGAFSANFIVGFLIQQSWQITYLFILMIEISGIVACFYLYRLKSAI